MTFDAHDAGTDVGGIRRETLRWGKFGSAPTLAVTAGDDAA